MRNPRKYQEYKLLKLAGAQGSLRGMAGNGVGGRDNQIIMRALFDMIKIQMNLHVMESERDPRPRKGPHPEEHNVNDALWTHVMQQRGFTCQTVYL